jgi:hypothetical protein
MVAPARRRHARTTAADKEMSTQSRVEGQEAAPPELSFTRFHASSYIVSMITELRCIAISADFRFLAYLLEIAFHEAYRLSSELEREDKRESGSPL